MRKSDFKIQATHYKASFGFDGEASLKTAYLQQSIISDDICAPRPFLNKHKESVLFILGKFHYFVFGRIQSAAVHWGYKKERERLPLFFSFSSVGCWSGWPSGKRLSIYPKLALFSQSYWADDQKFKVFISSLQNGVSLSTSIKESKFIHRTSLLIAYIPILDSQKSKTSTEHAEEVEKD